MNYLQFVLLEFFLITLVLVFLIRVALQPYEQRFSLNLRNLIFCFSISLIFQALLVKIKSH